MKYVNIYIKSKLLLLLSSPAVLMLESTNLRVEENLFFLQLWSHEGIKKMSNTSDTAKSPAWLAPSEIDILEPRNS